MRSKRFDRQLEADLIVAFAGRAVRDRLGALFFRHPGQRLGNDRAGHRSAEQIFSFVYCASFQGRPDILGDEFFPQIFHIDFAGAGLQRFFLDELESSQPTKE